MNRIEFVVSGDDCGPINLIWSIGNTGYIEYWIGADICREEVISIDLNGGIRSGLYYYE